MEKLSVQDVRDIVECEGLDYSITDKIRASEIGDPELRQAWAAADRALRRVDELLEAPDPEPTTSRLPERLIVDAQLMVDSVPEMFDGAPLDEHGTPVRTGAHDGRLSYVASGFYKEVYISGEFTADEILDAVRSITPKVSRHIVQIISMKDGAARHAIVFDRRGRELTTDGVRLDNHPLEL